MGEDQGGPDTGAGAAVAADPVQDRQPMADAASMPPTDSGIDGLHNPGPRPTTAPSLSPPAPALQIIILVRDSFVLCPLSPAYYHP